VTVAAAAEAILDIDHVTKRFGGLVAVNDVSFTVKRGEVFALIGPNGAGKTTLFNGITGIFPPSEGGVIFEGRDVAGSKPHEIASLGIARTFQNIRLFEYMSGLDNVRLGQHCRMHAKLWDSLFKTKAERAEERAVTERAMELLHFVGIERYAHVYARNLPYGSQRRLEIARAARDPAAAPAPGRAGRRLHPAGEGRAHGPGREDHRRGDHRVPHRARHEGSHGNLPPHRRARSWREDR